MRSGLLLCPPFVWFICGRMWCRKVLPATLPAPLSATLSPALWVYLRRCGAAGSASAQTACAICPTLRQSQSCHSHASPLHPSAVSAPPTSLDEWLFSIFLVLVPLVVRFSVSSGCARRSSVSTYAAILVLPIFLSYTRIDGFEAVILCRLPVFLKEQFKLVSGNIFKMSVCL